MFSGVFGAIAWKVIDTFLRALLMAAGSSIVTKGWLDGSQLQEAIGLIMGAASAIWSGKNAFDFGKLIAFVEDLLKSHNIVPPNTTTKQVVTAVVKKNFNNVPPSVAVTPTPPIAPTPTKLYDR